MLLPALLLAYAAGLTWIAFEIARAPVVDEDTGGDPWLAEDIRAALNGCEGVPIPVPPTASDASGGTSTGPGGPPCAGAGHFVKSPVHSTGE